MRQKRKILIWTRKSQHSNLTHHTHVLSGNSFLEKSVVMIDKCYRWQILPIPLNSLSYQHSRFSSIGAITNDIPALKSSLKWWAWFAEWIGVSVKPSRDLTIRQRWRPWPSLKNKLRILSLFFAIILRVQFLKRGKFWLELKRRDRGLVQTQVVEFIALPFPFPNKLNWRIIQKIQNFTQCINLLLLINKPASKLFYQLYSRVFTSW